MTVDELAASLTDAQKTDILEQPKRCWSTGTAIDLADRGFFTIGSPRYVGDIGPFRLTPLGLAVRERIQPREREMTPIERAARAVAEYTDQRLPRNGADPITGDGIVRAVLQAIREPSDEMELAGEEAGRITEGCLAGKCWQAMIDKALEDGK